MDVEKIRNLALSEKEIGEIVDDFIRALSAAASQRAGLEEARGGMRFRLRGLVPVGRILDALAEHRNEKLADVVAGYLAGNVSMSEIDNRGDPDDPTDYLL